MQEETVERRIVTVLFADLVGFTTLAEQFDAEDVAAIQDAYFATVRETIGRYGGRLEKFIGDAAMAVFGVPRSRDDDAERAVRAGAALVHAVEQIGARLGLEDDALRLRVGVNTGEAVIAAGGPDEGRVTGDTVNTAARLQTAAPAGGLLVGDTTALAVADVADLEPVQALQLKGKAGPTAARLLTGFRARASREQAMGALRAPTLGREHELSLLLAGHRRAADGSAERWLIVAPPGVGKSRLLRELGDRLAATAQEAVVWRARARPESVSVFDPIAGLLRDALASGPVEGQGTSSRSGAEATLISRLARAGAGEARARVVTDACLALAWPSEAAAESSKPDDRDALFTAWLEGLDALAGSATAVWLVEDVHWAGGDVLAFLDLAGSQPRSGDQGGRLVLVTTRPSLLDANPTWTNADEEAGRYVMHLATLQPTDARGLITALVGDALPPELVDRVAERSDGNCLFIEELLRTWVSVGTLVQQDGAWRLAVPAEEIPLPASVQSIYAAQLDDLPPGARRLARRASVAGRRFPLGALEPLGAQGDDGLEPLRRRELVTGPLPEPIWGEAFAYRHALLRDAGYASLARAERARLHARLARWLQQAAGERSSEVAEQIAAHYAAALESAPALAAEIDDGLDRETVRRLAADWYERAGQGTLSVSAHDAARQLFRRAIDLTADEARLEKARRWERLGDATAFAADMDEGAAAYQRAIDLYREAVAQARAGFDSGAGLLDRASTELETRMDWLGRLSPEGAEALAAGARDMREGAARLRQGGADLEDALAAARSGLARATASLADVWYQQLKFSESRDLASETIGQLDDADDASRARLLAARGVGSLGASGPSDEAEGDLVEALELARRSGNPEVELEALQSLTLLRHESGRGERGDWQAIGEKATRLGRWDIAIASLLNEAAMRQDDNAADVHEVLGQARELAISHGLIEDAGWTDYSASEAYFIAGEWDEAVAAGTRALDVAEQNAYRRLAVRVIHVLVPIAAVRGERAMLQRAAAFYASLVGRFEFPDSPYSRVIRTAQDLELAAAGLAEPPSVDVQSRLVSFDDEPGGGSWSAALDRIFRHWIEVGELDGAARALAAMEAALPRFRNVSRISRGTHELMRGRLALARGDGDEAAAAGRSALDHFRASASPWWMAKAIRLLERSYAADHELLSEVNEIERRLGAVSPTA